MGFKDSYLRVGMRSVHKRRWRVQRLAEVIQECSQEWTPRWMIENEFPIERLERSFSIACLSVGWLERCQSWVAKKPEIGLRMALAFRHFGKMWGIRREHQIRHVVSLKKFEIDVVG